MDYYGSGELEITLWKPEVRVLGLTVLNCLCTTINASKCDHGKWNI
jgi:hypothetical protein